DWNPYLGRTVRQEPVCRANVLPLTGDTSDDISIGRSRAYPRPVTFLRFRHPRPEFGGSLSGRPRRDRAPGCALEPGGPADPVDAGREPGQMASRAYHLVLRAIPARRALRGLPGLPPRLRLPVQFLLCQRRPPARPPPARPPDPSRRRRGHRLS